MTRQIHTLIVDDEPRIRSLLAMILSGSEYMVATAGSGEEALEVLRDTPFDLVILDLMLGGRVDGLKVLEAIKWRWPETAVIILTAHGSLESAMVAVREGADDYLLKPVEPDSFRQTVKAVMIRRERTMRMQENMKDDSLLRYEGIVVNRNKRTVTIDGRLLDLRPSEFALLVHLMHNKHRVIPARELVKVLRQYNCEDEREAREIIKWYIYRLRRKVEPNPSKPRYILNVWGIGYTFGQSKK